MSPTDPIPASSLLSVEGVSKRFGETEVLRSVDLSVARGEVLAVIGASGSGKTTLLRCLNGLEIPDAGRVTIADTTVNFSPRPAPRELRALRDRSAMVFQHYHLFPHRTVLDPELVGDVLTLMRDLAAEGWTMVVVTHELQFARDVAQQVAFVDQGRVLEYGVPAQVLRAPREERTRQFVHRLLHPL